MKPGQIILEDANDLAKLPKNFNDNYHIINGSIKKNHIYTFEQIGITDPFPFEND